MMYILMHKDIDDTYTAYMDNEGLIEIFPSLLEVVVVLDQHVEPKYSVYELRKVS